MNTAIEDHSVLPLQTAIKLINPDSYITWTVSTGNQGMTMNIPFQQRAANVSAYSASCWLLSDDGGKTYPFLAYTQTITMVFTIGMTHYTFRMYVQCGDKDLRRTGFEFRRTPVRPGCTAG